MWLKRRYLWVGVVKPVVRGRWLELITKQMGYAVIGAPGVEQVAIVHCLVVKVGKVWVAARMPLEWQRLPV
jgi:hypothetical protein